MSYDIILHETGPCKIQVIKLARMHTFPSLELKDAIDLLGRTPTIFVANISKRDAVAIRDALLSVGAAAEIVNRHERHNHAKRRMKRNLLLRRS
jgi:ribosomal protein L7/L12